jgi:hypothetical protein
MDELVDHIKSASDVDSIDRRGRRSDHWSFNERGNYIDKGARHWRRRSHPPLFSRLRPAPARPSRPIGGDGKIVEADETYFGDKDRVTKHALFIDHSAKLAKGAPLTAA